MKYLFFLAIAVVVMLGAIHSPKIVEAGISDGPDPITGICAAGDTWTGNGCRSHSRIYSVINGIIVDDWTPF